MWQPEPEQSWPGDPGTDNGPDPRSDPSQAVRPRRRGRTIVFGTLLTAGLAGLALSAVGVAHQLLPRQFTPAQRRAVSAWEMERRWRALPAASIFPASVPYELPAPTLYATRSLVVQARRLAMSPATTCMAALSGAASRTLSEHHCSAAMRATYVDSSGSLVATLTIAVLPSVAAARAVVRDLTGPAGHQPLVRTLRVSGTPAAGFGDAERQMSGTSDAGSYVLLWAVGFSDGRHTVRLRDQYQKSEMASLANGLQGRARSVLGGPAPVPACPGAPGC